MTLLNWNDIELPPHYMRDETEPYSLPIVVRVERGEQYNAIDSYEAVTLLMAKLFNEETWVEDLETWMQGRIRKVVRKARATAWENAKTLPHLYVKHKNIELLVFKPHKLDELNPILKKLQVQGIDFTHTTPEAFTESPALNIAVNPDLTMSTGKTLAQVAHSAQLFILKGDKSQISQWQLNNFPVNIVQWATIPDTSETITIQDAGLTEIPPGSYTVKAEYK